MTAVLHPDVAVRTFEVPGRVVVDQIQMDIDDFLRDPLGYGTYDYSDPISLDEFGTTKHMHGRYVTQLG